MKKLLSIILVLALMVTSLVLIAACNKETATYEIALVTDVGNIDDKSFNEGAWNGVKQFAEANGKTYGYFRPSEDSDESRIETIKTAIERGAKVVVCPGYLFEVAIYTLQGQYPNVNFLLLDGEPNDGAEERVYETKSNVHCILYKEEQAGYLAGYAAVMDGYRKLGFLGGIDVPAVVRFGFGFVQGAEAAGEELELAADAIDTVSKEYRDISG
ncbi:MAG TPA: BMP family ABC transporter substrate-binding protein, partial [Eubacteriales bacterium]|nr:BMP family ABC transporter substrate-binding protein [Eubacteriales bacterium]